MKRCSGCGCIRHAHEFNVCGTNSDGRQGYCRACHAEHAKRPDQAARRRARRLELVAELNRLKDHPCADCGGRFHPAVMEFDHVRGTKLFAIQANSLTRPDLADELAKCELRCANCHRLRHVLAGLVD